CGSFQRQGIAATAMMLCRMNCLFRFLYYVQEDLMSSFSIVSRRAMLRTTALAAVLFGSGLAFTTPVAAAPVVGQPAPAFTAVDSKGQQHKLGDYQGKVVVLEWTNHDCPYVKKHYSSANMQGLQKQATDAGVV